MLQLHKQIASVLGIGYIKGGGTFAAIAYCIIWFLLPAGFSNSYWQVAVTFLIILLGTWSANQVEKDWGKDSSRVVMDEVAGMAITLLYAPHTLLCLIIGLVLFRLFDIVKPFGIRRMEKLPGGVGVMADDILSGIYALIVLRIVIVYQANYFS
jgi:phosphatidylglycerophosphatase A